MSEPRRLREGGGPAALLLGSANDDTPSADSFERAAKRLGLVGAVVATSTLGATSAAASTGAAAGATGAGAATKTLAAGLATGVGGASTIGATGTSVAVTATGLSLVAKLVGVAAVGVALTTGVVVATRSPPKPTLEARSTPSEAPSSSAAPAPAPVTPPVASAAPDIPPEAPRDEPKERAPSKPTKSAGLRDEVALLDAARSALARGDTSSALAALGQHTQRFPQGFLRSEAAVLRVEALVRAGRRAEAQAEGERLLAREPNGPQAQRVRSLLGE